jgi:hypothetical protein
MYVCEYPAEGKCHSFEEEIDALRNLVNLTNQGFFGIIHDTSKASALCPCTTVNDLIESGFANYVFGEIVLTGE